MILWSAFLIGFLGSLHCLGMCGPIVLVLPAASGGRARFVAGRLLYNMGRTLTYGLLGVVAGAIGQSFAVAGWQQTLGIAAGALMILSVAIPAGALRRLLPPGFRMPLLRRLKARLGGLLADPSPRSLFTIGLLNGFLPCGLVYAAMAGSLAAGSVQGSVLFMVVFGLGTTPVMFAASWATGLVTAGLRRRVARLLPAAVVVMGALFILRGLSLGIPLISPSMDRMQMKARAAQQHAAPHAPPANGNDRHPPGSGNP